MRVLVSGAGIAGLTLGLTLQRVGIEATIVDKSAAPRGEGYMIDFFGPGYDAAEALGLLPDLAAIHYEIPSLVFLGRDGEERVSLRYAAVRKRLFRNRHFNFMRDELERVLHQRIGTSVRVHYGTEIVSLTEGGDFVIATLSDGSTDRWDAVVGADGIHSRVRKLIFGRGAERFLGYATAAFVLDEPVDSPDAFVTITEPCRQVSVYPIRGGRLATFFLHRRDEPLRDRSRAAAINDLRSTYAGMRWIVPRLLEKLDEVAEIYYDNVSQVEMNRWSEGPIGLVGDAAGCVSLVAGQGASLAMAGAYSLARELSRSLPERAFAAYEARLRPRVEKAQKSGRSIARWFFPETNWRIAVRNLGIRVSTWPPVAFFYRRALGGG